MSSQPENSRPRLKLFQFSLRSLLIAMMLIGAPLGMLVRRINAVQRQRTVVAAIKKNHGTAMQCGQYEAPSDWSESLRPAFVEKLMGHDFFHTINYVDLHSAPFKEFKFTELEVFPHLRALHLIDTPTTDADLELLPSLTFLETLSLGETKITDRGLVPIGRLPHLRVLHLNGTSISNNGMASLRFLSQLEYLELSDTPISDAGIEHLSQLTNLRSLELDGTSITDEALLRMDYFENLETLSLANTKITDAGLAHLHGLKKLERLYSASTNVTDAGVEELKRAIPGLDVRR